MLWAVNEDLRAYLFLFVEVACVGSGAATCRLLHSCLWSDGLFWRTYGGPCLFAEPPASSATHMRNTFRRWLFRLEGLWAEDFGQLVDEARQSDFGADYTQLLADARYVASGLMPCDDRPAVDAFAEIVVAMLDEYNPAQLDERSLAEALVTQVELREDVFTASQVMSIASAFDQSVERAILERGMEDRVDGHDHFAGALQDESEEEVIPEEAPWEPRADLPDLALFADEPGLEPA